MPSVRYMTNDNQVMKRICLLFTALFAAAIALTSCNKPVDEPDPSDIGAVDLGLSVKWADRNLGARSFSDYGDYYAWGETGTKSDYTWENHKWYVPNDYSVILPPYKKNERLLPEDDVATQKLGEGWRMPTYKELQELQRKCMWERVMRNGVNCYKVTSKINGNVIYLPMAGYKSYGKTYKQNVRGYYWSGERARRGLNNCAQYLNLFSLGNEEGVICGFRYCHYGFAVRPVYAGVAE